MSILFSGVKKIGGIAISYLVGVAGELTATAFYEGYQAFKMYQRSKSQGHAGYLEMDPTLHQPDVPQQPLLSSNIEDAEILEEQQEGGEV